MNQQLHIKLQTTIEKFRRNFPGYEMVITMSAEDMKSLDEGWHSTSSTRPPAILRQYMGINVQVGEFTSVGIKI